MNTRRFAVVIARFAIATFILVAPTLAARAPLTYYVVSNDGVRTDRFSDPETAARTSIDRTNARIANPAAHYVFDQIVPSGAGLWRIYYFQGGSGPYPYGSAVQLIYSCNLTPKLGPSWGEDVQGLPMDASAQPHTCPSPTVDDAKNGCNNCEGNPINSGRATKYQTETDFRGTPYGTLKFARHYRSVEIDGVSLMPFRTSGVLWRNSFESAIRVTTVGTASSAVAVRPDGRLLAFNLTAGNWVPDADIADRLSEVLDGSGARTAWVYRTADDTTETYDAGGVLQTITNRAGISQTLVYSDATTSPTIAPIPGLVIGVTDSLGQSLAFTYNSKKQIHTMTVPGGGSFTYTYDSLNNAQSVTYPDGATRTYVYGELAYTTNVFRPNNLTGIIDESGTRFATFRYDWFGRAIRSEHGTDIERTSLSYTMGPGSDVSAATVTDALGAVRTRQFQHVLGVAYTTSLTQSCGASCTSTQATTYDAQGNVASRRDFNGNLTCHAYDLTRNLETARVEGFAPAVASCPGNLASYTPAPGTRQRKTLTAWSASFRLPVLISESNRTTSFTRDANGNVLTRTVTDTSVSPAVSRTWTYTYNSFGRVLTEDGPRTDVSDVTTFSYYNCTSGYQCGQLHAVTNALGHTTSYDFYNALGQPTQITDPNGLLTTLAYDLRERLTDRCVGGSLPTCVGGELTHLDYWPTGLLRKVTNPDDSYIEYTYDAAHRLTQINDGAQNKVVYTLDNMGNRTAENTYDPGNALRRTHGRVFSTLNQLWKDVNAAGTAAVTTTFGYDNNGNQTSVAAPLARNSGSLYDELNRLKQITDPASGITLFGYDAQDNLTSVTDPRSLVTSYGYDGFGDLLTQTSPDTGVTTNTYDSAGNLDTSSDSRGALSDYDYDAANRVTSVSYTLGGVTDQTISYGYDAGTNQLGSLTSASDADHTLAWTYDTHGRVTGKGQTVGGVTLAMGYGYDAAGRLGNVQLPSGNTVTFGYNANGQVSSVSLNGGTTILSGITYDPFGPVTGWTWGNGTTASRGFDTDGKITQVDNANGVSLKNYGYDDAFRITSVTDALDPMLSWTYGYDSLDRLNAASKSGLSQGWTYDANGNRLTETGTNPSTYTNSSTSNRLSSTSGSLGRSYNYDNSGNTLSFGAAAFTYNNRGRMQTASNAGTTATYTYNALGQRIRRATSSVTTLYVYDEAGHLAGEYTAAGALVQETVWLGDIPVATLRPNGSGGVDLYYVHTDHLNTPRLVTDTANNIRWRWDSDAFGTTPPNENPSSLGAFEYNLRFPGQQYDSVVGLHYNYYRDLDPATGRYVESDPIGIRAGPSLYAYARNSPSSLVDPTGLLALTVATQWSEVSTLAEGHLGFTYADIIHTKCTCACSNGEWKLVGCSSTLLIDVSLRPDYTSRRQEQFARRGEQQHVDDFKKGAAEVRRAGEEREWALRYEPFSSKSQCEKFISSDVEYAMKQALGNVLEETLDRDRHGEHTYPFKE